MKQWILKFLKAWRVAVNAFQLTCRYDRGKDIVTGGREKAATAWSKAAIACMMAHDATARMESSLEVTDRADQKAIDACLIAGLLGDQWRRKEPGYVSQLSGKEASNVGA